MYDVEPHVVAASSARSEMGMEAAVVMRAMRGRRERERERERRVVKNFMVVVCLGEVGGYSGE